MVTAVVGLDVSLDRLGWGAVDGATGEPVACGCVNIRPDGTPDNWDADRPVMIRQALRHVALQFATRDVLAVYLEAPYIGPNRQTVTGLMMAVGSAWQAASRAWPRAALGFVTPSEWRKLTGVPAVPFIPGSRKHVGKAEERAHAVELGAGLPDEVLARVHRAEKPLAMLRAYQLGFDPPASAGGQDAADAALIAAAGRVVNDRLVAAV